MSDTEEVTYDEATRISTQVFLIQVKEGAGAIHVSDIGMILPDTNAPKTRSVIYTGLAPGGLTVEGNSELLIGLWGLNLLPEEDEYDEEDEELEAADDSEGSDDA